MWMIYGATGYTGQLITEVAVARGHKPLLAGRSEGKVSALAQRFALDYVVFPMDKFNTARAVLAQYPALELVLHCAGPYIYTSQPMLDACLANGVHYLDLTGELSVYENTFAHHALAEEKGIVLMSGVGFDIVPSDCLGKYVVAQLPDAVELEVVLEAFGGDVSASASAGTLKSLLEMLPHGGRVRRGGQLIPYDFGQGADWFEFPHGKRMAVPITWGDLSTAYRTTGVPNITTYMSMPPQQIDAIKRLAYPLRHLLKNDRIRATVRDQIEANVKGPSEQARQTVRTHVYVRATAADGRIAEAWLESKEGYAFTADAAVLSVERVLDGNYSGAHTPAGAFGADFVLDIPTTVRHDVLP